MLDKTIKISGVVLILLFLAHVIPLCLATGENTLQPAIQSSLGEGKYPDVPGASDNAVQYNKTNITPVAEMQQIKAGEPALFQYRNITMLMNCTQNCEIVFTADPQIAPKILAISIEPNQNMTLTMNFSSSPFQNELLRREKNFNFYANIEPNATFQLSAQLRLFINQTELDRELNWEVNSSKLTWMYWNGTQSEWVKVPSTIDQYGYLVCDTDHFSIWTVGEDSSAEEAQAIMDITFIFIALGVGIAVILAIGITLNSKRR